MLSVSIAPSFLRGKCRVVEYEHDHDEYVYALLLFMTMTWMLIHYFRINIKLKQT